MEKIKETLAKFVKKAGNDMKELYKKIIEQIIKLDRKKQLIVALLGMERISYWPRIIK